MNRIGKKLGVQTFALASPPVIIATGTVVGPFEGKNAYHDDYDMIAPDLSLGQSSFELAEKEMMTNACQKAMQKAKRSEKDIDLFIAGDLLNQLITSGYSASYIGLPFFGVYGACSTSMASLGLASLLIDGGFIGTALTATSSHNATAERQYRYPTEYGNQKRPYAQWTVTGAGAALITTEGKGPRVTHVTVGKVTDLGTADPLNLGAAMAPAAVASILQHFADTKRTPEDYDLIVTGDLGNFGAALFQRWLKETGGIDLGARYFDCGAEIYDRKKFPKVQSGGSGCGCSAVVVFGHLFKEMIHGRYRRILVAATGALHSPTSVLQKQTIPCIAHAIAFEFP
ncbi:MAG TPA: stage V sporulation protein AD [Bacillota bacterium]|nr:stage V sporulation protein AD [Bacillota bacterium]